MRTVIRKLVALLVLVVLSLVAAPAARADGPLELSADGVIWSDAIGQPLFDPSVTWVPGDVREASFFVRNRMPEIGDLTVVLARSNEDDLAETGQLTVSARTDGGPWYRIDPGTDRDLLTSSARGRSQAHVELQATYETGATSQSMVLATDLDLRLRLTQAEASTDTPDPGPHHPSLPDTGSALRPWLLSLSLLLLGGGAVLVARRTEDEELP